MNERRWAFSAPASLLKSCRAPRLRVPEQNPPRSSETHTQESKRARNARAREQESTKRTRKRAREHAQEHKSTQESTRARNAHETHAREHETHARVEYQRRGLIGARTGIRVACIRRAATKASVSRGKGPNLTRPGYFYLAANGFVVRKRSPNFESWTTNGVVTLCL